MTTSKFKTICLFCGSSLGKKKSYKDAAIDLAKELQMFALQVMKNIDLVYGGGNIGLMGLIAQTLFDGGRHVLGVIPTPLMDKEITSVTIGDLKPVKNIHQRKAEMSLHADTFIVMHGLAWNPIDTCATLAMPECITGSHVTENLVSFLGLTLQDGK
ncbi:cytokinin riboside 5'-monophosphate phosphoribohydrolase LOG1-like [Dioscorea cayenensis subsp. rotundata]|uniref:cytokinin riboside 5'-monophosphate phosphoribohydrolase n=1 Tax=Dioscorea cayennensis subsp. rotundata TaxID=55577 RepID=A0AB40CH57_DIOCR|nr:cytokinin riboside 5'-monophosphate phosphoribohydrolase LOG1-like [Dioscorea cayenensis subsp. rotundata]